MPNNEASVTVRFGVKDSDLVKKALQEFGAEGQRVLDKLENATQKPSLGIKALNAAVADGKSGLAGLAASAGSVGSVLSAIGPTGIAAAAGIAGIAGAAKFAFEAVRVEAEKVGKLKDVADQIGVTTSALQELRYAAGQSGVEQEKLGSALSRFGANIGEAVQGAGALGDVLRQYHIGLVNSNKETRSTVEILSDFADAVKNAGSDQERLRMSVAAFGREGAAMVNMLRDGSAGLATMADEAHQVGAVLDGALIDRMKRLNDQFDRIKVIGENARVQAMMGWGPESDRGLKNMEAIERASGSIRGAWDGIVNSILSLPANWFNNVYDKLTRPQFGNFDASAMQVIAGLHDWSGRFTNGNASLNLTTAEVTKLKEELTKLVVSTDAVAAANEKYQRGQEIVNQLVADGSMTTAEASKANNALTDAFNEVTIAAAFKATPAHKSVEAAVYGQTLENEKLIAAMNKSQYEYDVTVKKLKLVKDGFEGTEEAADAYARTLVDQERAQRGIKQSWDDQANAAKKLAEDKIRAAQDQARAINRIATDLGAGVVDGFINMAEGSKKPFDRLLNYAKQTFEKIAAEALLNPVIIPIISQAVGGALSGYVGTAAGSAAGGGGYGGFGPSTALSGLSLAGSNAINAFGMNYLGLGAGSNSLTLAQMSAMTPAQLSSALTMPSLTAVGGYGLAGAGLGYLYASAIGGNKTTGSLGGAAAGMALAFGQPEIAAAIAVITAIASAFGPGPSDRLQGNWVNFAGNSLTPYGYTGNKYSAENAGAASQLGNSLLSFGTVLKGAGLKTNFASNARVEVGSNGAPYRVWYGGINGDTNNGVFQNPQDAFRAVADAMLKSLTEVPASIQKIIDSIDYSNLDKFASDIQDALNWTATVGGIKDQLQQIKDPKGHELKMLDDLFNPLKEKARETGEGLADIEELYGIKRRDILARYADPTNPGFDAQSAWAAMNNAEGRGYLVDVNSAVLARTKALAAAGTNATGQDWANRAFSATLSNILGNGNLTADHLSIVKATFASMPDVIAAADAALASLVNTVGKVTPVADPAVEALARLPDIIRDAANAQIDMVNEQIDTALKNQSFYHNAGGSLRNAALDLDFNAATSASTIADKFAMAQNTFESDRTLALLGNREAIDRLAGEGEQFATLAKQMFGSSSQFVDIQKRVKDTFLKVADLADRQVDLMGQALSVAQEQLEVLRRIAANATTGGVAVPKTYTAADLDALTKSFGAAYAAGQAPPGSSTFEFFKQTLLTEIGGLNDVGRLRSDLSTQRGRLGSDDPTAVAAPDIVKAIVTQLGKLGVVTQEDVGLINLSKSVDQLVLRIDGMLARTPRAA